MSFNIPRITLWRELSNGKFMVVKFIFPSKSSQGIAIPREIWDRFKIGSKRKITVYSIKQDGSLEVYEDKVSIRKFKCGKTDCVMFYPSKVVFNNATLVIIII